MAASSGDAPRAKVEHLEGTEWQKSRSFCPAVITEGGRIVWLAGQTTLVDLDDRERPRMIGRIKSPFRTKPSALRLPVRLMCAG